MPAASDRSLIVAESRSQLIYRGTSFAVMEVTQSTNQIAEKSALLVASVKTLNDMFQAQRPVDVKLAAENVSKLARDLEHIVRPIPILSDTLVKRFSEHVSRRAHP